MAPLSKQLTGVVLDHKFYGSHLNSQQQTTNEPLERKNFQHAAERLASIFQDMVYDGHKTVAKYVKPPKNRDDPKLSRDNQPEYVDAKWVHRHVTASKYLLQIICCDVESCCPDRPSHLKKILRPILPNGFLPPPVKLQHRYNQNEVPLEVSKDKLLDKSVKFATLQTRIIYPCDANTPFDSFCPSMQSVLQGTICDICKKSFPSHAQMLVHRRAIHKHHRYQQIKVDDLIKLEHDKRLTKIKDIIDHVATTKEYKAIFDDGSVDWITIVNDQHQKVRAYFKQKGINIEVFDVAKADWMNPVWIEEVLSEN